MKTKNDSWDKNELHTYILLLCANADSEVGDEEVALIKGKVDAEIFERIYKEFSADTEDVGLEKISRAVQMFEYSHAELQELRAEMETIYFADQEYTMMERNLDRILDNIIY